jgi:hypothetical protein
MPDMSAQRSTLKAMRVSQRFKLGLTQPSLDFVDVDIVKDTALFLDPRALRLHETDWGQECVSLVKDYFTSVLDAVQAENETEGVRLLSGLHEPNETHLGLSAGRSAGRGVGDELARDLWRALAENAAVTQSNLLEDLEETALLVDGVGRDRISDVTTNIIREPLIHYTQAMCGFYGIPRKLVSSGPLWSPAASDWVSYRVELPVVPSGKLLLVPRAIVRATLDYDYSDYFNNEILEYLKGVEQSAGSQLVELLKNGSTRVTKKALKEKYGTGKAVATDLTRLYPDMLKEYRDKKSKAPSRPLNHEDLARDPKRDLPDWDGALRSLGMATAGIRDATAYHNAVMALLTMTMNASWAFPVKEKGIHANRKRIDISYSNVAVDGFFAWLKSNHPAAHIYIECKNLTGDPKNPELDQIGGRFSPSRGKFGLLLCREFVDKDLFWERCKDTAVDDRGWIIPLDDVDLRELVDMVREPGTDIAQWQFWKTRFDRLTD